MDRFKCEQIWLVNFDPSFGHEYKKVRPALIIQNNRYIKSGNLMTVIPISSQTNKQTELDFLLKKDYQNRLMKNSLLKIKQISSFDKRRFIKQVGIVDKTAMDGIRKNIRNFLM